MFSFDSSLVFLLVEFKSSSIYIFTCSMFVSMLYCFVCLSSYINENTTLQNLEKYNNLRTLTYCTRILLTIICIFVIVVVYYWGYTLCMFRGFFKGIFLLSSNMLYYCSGVQSFIYTLGVCLGQGQGQGRGGVGIECLHCKFILH